MKLTICRIKKIAIFDGTSIRIAEEVEHGAGDDDGLLVGQERGGDHGCLVRDSGDVGEVYAIVCEDRMGGE
jgi:hypothetical protein